MAENQTPIFCRLYLISPDKIDDIEGFSHKLIEALNGGDVASFQLRLKDASDEHIIKVAKALMPICHSFEVAFIINDHADIAAKVGADGVHLGQEDGSIKEARELVGHDAVIGVTCHNSRHLAFEAGDNGADYVAFGAFYPSDTKQTPLMAEPEILTWWTDLSELPCVAIGGINVENCKPLIKAGTDFIATCSAVWDNAEGPKQAVAQFNKILCEED